MKNFNSKLKIKEINKEISTIEFQKIFELIKDENTHTIVSKLGPALIREYLNIASLSKNIFLFVLKKQNKIIGYSLYVKNEKYLVKDFENIKLKIFFDLLFKFKFFSLINIFLAISKLDLILVFNKKNLKNQKNLNLNLLAINKKYQSQGIGEFFFIRTIKIIYKKKYKFKTITCEAPTRSALNFYLNKIKFKLIGKKIRLTTNLFILKKKINEI